MRSLLLNTQNICSATQHSSCLQSLSLSHGVNASYSEDNVLLYFFTVTIRERERGG